ncbi:MAG: alanine racemase [Verrucomicrobiae bacterium]|nr:alanine racemase [Verrucomicrobiae bacterium]NNJ87405.1 alanine racemase [Akkermansiaceae bacterium]
MQDNEWNNLPRADHEFDIGLTLIIIYIPRVSESVSKHPVSPPRAWAEINLAHLRHNLGVARSHHAGGIMAILKAGAYGHGMVKVAESLENLPGQEKPDFLGVASVIEARRLADAGIQTRIYLLGPSCPFEREEIVSRNWTPCISSLAEAHDFNALAEGKQDKKLKVHITVDTGMGRGGFLPNYLPQTMAQLRRLEHLDIEGIGSHLPSADEDEEFTKKQFDNFDSLVENLGADQFKYIHLANSAGILDYQSRTTNLYRPGLMLYGISPLLSFQPELKPVLSLKSKVSLVRNLPAGHGISYGRDTVLEKDTNVATIGIGYGDGYPRALPPHQTSVIIHDKRCPLLGRVTMDQIMVDVSGLPTCQSGDEVELFGENILASEIARLSGTIPWALLTGITPRVKRIYSA